MGREVDRSLMMALGFLETSLLGQRPTEEHVREGGGLEATASRYHLSDDFTSCLHR